jgi:hypothetical protein
LELRYRLGGPFDEIASYIKANIPQKDSLLVFANMQLLYAASQRDSYRGVPFQFWLGQLPAPGNQTKKMIHTIYRTPPMWIVTYRGPDRFRINAWALIMELEDFILMNYELVNTWDQYMIYRFKINITPVPVSGK